jgi:Ca2+-binding EF-hand superfamily protein
VLLECRFDGPKTLRRPLHWLVLIVFADQTFSDDDIRYMLRQFSDKATVDFVSFATSLHEKIGDSRYHEAFGDAFDLFDTGMRGELSADDLIDGMAKLGENLSSAEAEDMIKLAAKVRGVPWIVDTFPLMALPLPCVGCARAER